jgi:hypothetical protein
MAKSELVLARWRLADLQVAIMENDNARVKDFLLEIDRDSANAAFRAAGEVFGFPTAELPNGIVIASAGHLAAVFGYKNPHGLIQLLRRWGISGVKVGGFTHDVCIQLKQALSLDPDDNRSILLEYSAFLVAGMYGTNKEAEAVKLYLFKCEQIARVGIAGAKSLKAEDPAKLTEMIIRSLGRIAKTPNGAEKEAMWGELENLTGRKYMRPRQLSLVFSQPGTPEKEKDR